MREIKLLAGERLIRIDGTVIHGPGIVSLDDFEPTYPGIIKLGATITDVDRRLQSLERSREALGVDGIAKAMVEFIFKDLRSNGPIARAIKEI